MSDKPRYWYSATLSIFSTNGLEDEGVRQNYVTQDVYDFKARSNGGALGRAMGHCFKVRKAFGGNVRVRLNAVLNKVTGERIFYDFEENSGGRRGGAA